ncbi:MAG: hypothetical protein LBU43_06925 [Candidatus Accumulibacter sp.]|nr:hypothetical protein [Accumulibacter sp.]
MLLKEAEQTDRITPWSKGGKTIAENKARTDLQKIFAAIEKINAETRKLQVESRWYPLLIGLSLFAAGGAFVKLFM